MFKFLKDKLKGAISKFSKKVGEEVKAEEPIKEEKIGGQKQEVKEQEIKEEAPEAKEEIPKPEEVKKEIKPKENKETVEEPKKKGFFGKIKESIVSTKLSYEKFENLFYDMELILMENNVALEVIEKIKSDLSQNLVEKPIKRTKIEEIIKESLKSSIDDLFKVEEINLLRKIKYEEKPFVIAFFGINGSGKTTTIAKIANLLKEKKISCVLAASDTFRAASIEQLQYHADKLGIKIIKHDYGSDPAAVAFDAIKHAKAKNIDVVLIDTAGRLQSNKNLMEEIKKIIRVSKPNIKIFVGEAITGNDCIEQATTFDQAIGIDGIILAKADIDEKGGAAISVSYVTKKPIIYLGTGQKYEDLKDFEPDLVVDGLGLR